MQPSSQTSPVTEVTTCEVCGNRHLIPFLNLGKQPLPDDLLPCGNNPHMNRLFPIEVQYCPACCTANQRFRVDRDLLFHPSYHYRAAQTLDVLDGMRQFVSAVERFTKLDGLKVLDVGCNDGSLLDFFREAGARTYGIEPTNAGSIAAKKGHAIDHCFFDVPMAVRFYKTYGCPDVITFTNVFAHIDNLESALASLMVLIDGDRVNPGRQPFIVIENHYLGSVLEKHQFDTFYLEHPRTYSYTSFAHIADRIGYHIEWAEFPARYGGNIRVVLAPGLKPRYEKYLKIERGFRPYVERFAGEIELWERRTAKMIYEQAPIRMAAFPARASILLNYLELGDMDVEAIYEKEGSPKIGHYAPGTFIPILSEKEFDFSDNTPLWNLAWHIPAEIEARWRSLGFKGDIINIVEKDLFDAPLQCTWP